MRRIRSISTLALVVGMTCAPALSCGDPEARQAAGSTVASSATEQVAPIVGRWQQLHTCQQLVDALNALGLGALAPGVVGDYFPDRPYDELAAKDDLCSGATPEQHSHFFTADGLFGSLDQYGSQVDDGTWTIVDSNTFRIGNANFDYSVRGDILQLTPAITDKQRRQALRHPEDFTTAGWMVAVSYPGTKWKQVSCEGWC